MATGLVSQHLVKTIVNVIFDDIDTNLLRGNWTGSFGDPVLESPRSCVGLRPELCSEYTIGALKTDSCRHLR